MPTTTDLMVSHRCFERATTACGMPPAVQQELWDRLAASAGPARLGVRSVAWYGGASVLLVAMGLFLGTSWATVGSGAGLALVLLYLAVLAGGCEALRARGHQEPAGLLAATVVALVPLAVFAAQATFGLWTEHGYGDYGSLLELVSGQWVVMEVATLAASVAVWRRYRTPFLLLPTAVAGWFLAMDLADAVGGDRGSAPVSALVALALLGVATALDRRPSRLGSTDPGGEADLREADLRGEAFWLHLSGLASLAFALGAADLPTGGRMLLVGLAGAACLAAGVLLARRVHLVFGAQFTFSALAYLAYDVFGGSPAFALVLGVIGVAIVLGGIRLDRAGDRGPSDVRVSPAA